MLAPNCPYCLRESLGGFNDEHVIPAKLGGTLVIRAHTSCNEGAARWIDNPLMADGDVELLRALSGVRNTRTRRVRGGQFRGQLDDDAPALLVANPGGIDVVQVAASPPRHEDSGDFTFSLPVHDVEKRTEKVLERLQAEHPGRDVELVRQERRRAHVTIERSWSLAPWVWPRFAAKVALGVLSLTMPPQWRGSDGELSLLALFRRGQVIGSHDDEGLSAVPMQLHSGDSPFELLAPWEHVVAVTERPGRVAVTTILFGELSYTLGVVTEGVPTGPRAWLCDWRERKPLVFASVERLAAGLVERMADFGPASGRHQDRPRGQLLGPVATARLRESEMGSRLGFA